MSLIGQTKRGEGSDAGCRTFFYYDGISKNDHQNDERGQSKASENRHIKAVEIAMFVIPEKVA